MNELDFGDLDEELLAQKDGAPTDEVPIDPASLGSDPKVFEAREARDKDVAVANLAQGITDIGSSLASQGRVHANPAVFDAARKEAQTTADEAAKDALGRRKTVSDFIKAKAAGAKGADAEEWRQRNFDQRERAIGAQQEQRDKPTGDQSKVAGFGRRMEQADQDFADIEKGGLDRSSAAAGAMSVLPNFVKGHLPGALEKATGVSGAQLQRQDQAERNFLNAVLRRESGAAISPSEFQSGEAQYFPRAGDSQQVKEQKARNRRQVIESMKAEAQNAWGKTPVITNPGADSGGKDKQALEWANANPDDPRAAKIKQRLGQ